MLWKSLNTHPQFLFLPPRGAKTACREGARGINNPTLLSSLSPISYQELWLARPNRTPDSRRDHSHGPCQSASQGREQDTEGGGWSWKNKKQPKRPQSKILHEPPSHPDFRWPRIPAAPITSPLTSFPLHTLCLMPGKLPLSCHLESSEC